MTPFPVDHSVFGSLAFLIETENARVLYSGDLRLHGRKKGMAEALLDTLVAHPVDTLLMEGTHFSSNRESGPSEWELEAEIRNQIRTAESLVFALFSPMHVDRFVSFYKAARKEGRNFVVDVYGAFILHLVSGEAHLPQPSRENGIRVYYPRHFEKTWRQKNLGKIHRLFTNARVELDEIISQPNKWLMLFRPTMLAPDFVGKLPHSVRCIYSYWEGYLRRSDWIDFRASVQKANGHFVMCHTSGHIFQRDIVRFARRVDARQVIPIHTNDPRAFAACIPNARLVSDGETICL